MFDAFTVRLLAVLMTAVVVTFLVVSFRWERRGGKSLNLRASTPVARGVVLSWTPVQAVLFFYPAVVAILPDATYGTILNFSFPFDSGFQVFGILLWSVGWVLLLWCSRLLGSIMSIDGVAEDHKLVTQGPFAVIRHPTYTANILVVLGATAFFLSYVLLAVAVLAIVLAGALARGEEQLLASPEGFGEEYRAYAKRTGRFLPRFARRRSP